MRSLLRKVFVHLGIHMLTTTIKMSCHISGANPGNSGCFPFDKKFQFEFAEMFSDERNIILQNFRKRGQTCEVYWYFRKFGAVNFHSIWFSSPGIFGWIVCFKGIQQFLVFLEKFSQEISTPFVPVLNVFGISGWMEGTLCNRGL